MATRRLKLRFSKVIPSFRFCRSIKQSSVSHSHVPIKYLVSPCNNQKSLDISFPNPPPSTPETSSTNRFITTISSEVGCGGIDCSAEPPEWWWTGAGGRQRKMYSDADGNVSRESEDGDVSSNSPLVARKRFGRKRGPKGTTFTVKSQLSSSSGDSGWSSSDEVTTLSSSRVFSNSSSNDHDEIRTLISTTTSNSVPSKSNSAAVKKSLKRQPSKLKSSTKTTPSFLARKGSTMKTAVTESVAVEKRSEDPYGDFKRSMMEMILEKQMFETGELEELLRCFLMLNSRCHHKVIVEAFTDIWEVLFAKSPLKNRRGVVVTEKRLTWE